MAQKAALSQCLQMLQFLHKSFTKLVTLEARAAHGPEGRSVKVFPNASISVQILYKIGHFGALGASCSEARSVKVSSNASISVQILYKICHFGASGASLLRRPLCQSLFKCFNFFRNPLQNWSLWSLGRLMAPKAALSKSLQMLQFL